ncbi:MAG: DNA repair protein RecO [Lentimicrobiaceae bacterium]|jgi:DNA repair protein RecO (recombination protein O)|nr:DNA repair protein RecO [Lentimicrobiaceae bacterium]
MSIKTRGIVFQYLQYGDTSLIVKIFSEEHGLQSFLVKGALSKRSKFRVAFFQPMSIIEFVVSDRNNKGMKYMSEIYPGYVYQNIPFQIHKKTIVLYMSELLSKTIAEGDRNKAFFSFIYEILIWLDLTTAPCANFPLFFTIELTRFLGFYPKLNDSNNFFRFDMLQGSFVSGKESHAYFLPEEFCVFLREFCTSRLEQIHQIQITNQQRRELLNQMLLYYKIHIPSFGNLCSHDVLKEVFE